MAPTKVKVRSEGGLKGTLTSKAKLPTIIPKRKADGSPLKPATAMQVKRHLSTQHLIDCSSKENSVVIKTKNQLVAQMAASKKPLGDSNHINTLNSVHVVHGKNGKEIPYLSLKKESVTKLTEKINIVKANATTVKSKLIKTLEVKTDTAKTTSVKPISVKELKTSLPKPVEPKIKSKNDIVSKNNVTKPVKAESLIQVKRDVIPKKTKVEPPVRTEGPVTRLSLNRRSSDNESTLYESALEEIFHNRLAIVSSLNDTTGTKKGSATSSTKTQPINKIKVAKKPPPGVEDFDLATQDLFSVGKFAFRIFEYLKSRESHFKVSNYMAKQKSISKGMRALLVDWLVEIQECFELNHETLYLAVKIIDLYLSKEALNRDQLQLLGCAAMLISCKYEERMAPLLDDFIDISDHQFSAKDVTSMECKVLKTIDYDLGCPLSYRFLRRYSRCAKFNMPLLTLARYILELSLMDFSMALESESKLAAAALYLALRMKKESTWTPTLEYYSGYKVEDFKDLVKSLNAMLHMKPKEKLINIRKKYSHEVFHSVALIPLLDQVDFPPHST